MMEPSIPGLRSGSDGQLKLAPWQFGQLKCLWPHAYKEAKQRYSLRSLVSGHLRWIWDFPLVAGPFL